MIQIDSNKLLLFVAIYELIPSCFDEFSVPYWFHNVFLAFEICCQVLQFLHSLLQTTIEALKERLRDRSGTAVESMYLQLYDDEDNKICDLLEDFRPLGYYSPFDGYACFNSPVKYLPSRLS